MRGRNKLMLGALLVACCLMGNGAGATSWTVEVGTASVVVAPNHNKSSAAAWASGTTYPAGAYMTASNGKIYWTPNGGTSTTSPTHREGIAAAADGVKWLYLSTRGRKEIELVLYDPGDLYLERSANAATATGAMLVGKGSAANYSGYSGEINALAASGTLTLGVQEF